MYVLDVGTRWIKYQRDIADGKTPVTSKSAKQPSKEELLAMVNRVKNRSAK